MTKSKKSTKSEASDFELDSGIRHSCFGFTLGLHPYLNTTAKLALPANAVTFLAGCEIELPLRNSGDNDDLHSLSFFVAILEEL